jgi:hypothetical protein
MSTATVEPLIANETAQRCSLAGLAGSVLLGRAVRPCDLSAAVRGNTWVPSAPTADLLSRRKSYARLAQSGMSRWATRIYWLAVLAIDRELRNRPNDQGHEPLRRSTGEGEA